MRRPLIFVPDTCVLLDIVRAPVRREFSQDNSKALLTILEWVRTGDAALQFVIPSIVRDEFERNIDTVVRDASQELERIFKTHAHADTTLGLLLSREIQSPREDAMQLIDRCRDLASELLNLARQAATVDVDLNKAANRSMRGHAPAKRGKSSLGDCVITEFALRLAKEYGSDSERPSVILISSNTVDYCEGRCLNDSLQTEFDAVGLGYCRNWAEARWSVPKSPPI